MHQFKFRKGKDIPITGAPVGQIVDGPAVRRVAVLGADYLGLKPRLSVAEGDVVVAGAPIMVHKDQPQVQIVSPVCGTVKAINRGARRKLISVEIELGDGTPMDFSDVGGAAGDALAEKLCAAGLWTSFRTRPYSKVPAADSRPAAIYVTAMDTEPLAGDAAVIIGDAADDFARGLAAVATLSERTYLCHAPGDDIPTADGVEVATFDGPHPAGLAGTHMHFLTPPTASRFVWTIGYHDVIAIGRLLDAGVYDPRRVIALTGPQCANPRLIRTIAGASMDDLLVDDLPQDVPTRVISGSVLSGRAGDGVEGFLGRYARQITVMEEDTKQIPLGWIRPMPSKYALQPVLASALSGKLHALTTNLNGGRRAMVPTGTFEQLFPQDYLPTQMLRALLVMDTDVAQKLGALELDEEDTGLAAFACPAKYEYGLALRDCLTKIEKEG